MGTLEEMRDLIRELVDDGEDLALFDELAMEWHNAGCPGYEPAPWGKAGEVPVEDGVYALHIDVDSRPLVVVITIRGGVASMEGNPETISVTSGGAGPIRFRYLCPLPTPPEDV